ncbi:ArsA family ATPase [Egibacter rhizosphaerae]|uniref:ArsA family ATPase n=2 Tax=Egibacter rhizosphaerae TaxID=1670831 RepID=A0A411YL80_9ACTN|nr:ArsA family ATPase [Egibacter rhizosphaerae]
MIEAARAGDLDEVIAGSHVIVCTGSGGVGKTTTAAAIAVAAARKGRRTIVLTIDPARRLAQSLGLSSLDNWPRPVEAVDGLDAMMLDMKRTFDEVIERHADSAEHVRNITRNRFYQQLSSSLAGTQEYMAMEKLYDLHREGTYDCIVIDTPPTRNALDFLDAPRRLTDFLEGRFLRMFLSPGVTAGRWAGKAVGFGTGMFMRAASRITGSGVLEDLGEFFQSFEGMYEGFKQRANDVYHLLQSSESGFVVVSTAEDHTLREARYFLQRLARDGMPTAGLVVNRTTPPLPDELADSPHLRTAAASLADGEEPAPAAAALLELAAEDDAVAHREHRALVAGLHRTDPGVLVEIPQRAEDIHDIGGLDWVGAHLRGVA